MTCLQLCLLRNSIYSSSWGCSCIRMQTRNRFLVVGEVETVEIVDFSSYLITWAALGLSFSSGPEAELASVLALTPSVRVPSKPSSTKCTE